MKKEVVLDFCADYIQRYVDYIINDGYVLPTAQKLKKKINIDADVQISWTIVSGEAEIVDGCIVKKENSLERQPIELSAQIAVDGCSTEISFAHITLIDKYTAYILLHFGGNDKTEKIHMGYSRDGLNWKALNSGNAVFKPQIGNGRVRDPFAMRKKDGSFLVVASQGWDNPTIYFWDSENLVSFDNERLVAVAKAGVGGLTGLRAWAPEAIYDSVKDEYLVFWSDPFANDRCGATYANSTKDLVTVSEPFVLFDAGYRIIDATIEKCDGSYYIAFKDERAIQEGGKVICFAKSDTLCAGTFKQFTGAVTEYPVEGPILFKNNEKEQWYHYYDYFEEGKFGVSVTDDIDSGKWTFLGKSATMPTEYVRHGDVIPVTEKELERILSAYDEE